MSIKEGIQQIAQNPKVAGSVAGMTAALGAAMESAISWIPDDIGKLATLVGLILSVILIRVHLTSLKKAQLELKIIRDKQAERHAATVKRGQSGQPLRREEDLTN